jgi:hypothetical protein
MLQAERYDFEPSSSIDNIRSVVLHCAYLIDKKEKEEAEATLLHCLAHPFTKQQQNTHKLACSLLGILSKDKVLMEQAKQIEKDFPSNEQDELMWIIK